MKKTVRLSLLVQQVRTAGRENAAWLMLMAAFAAVYVIWGSTYLAIHFAIQTMPPLLMLGGRFVIAGALLLGWLLVRGTRLPDAEQTLQASFIGVLTVGIGVGSVAWAEQYIPSGLAALLAATVPMFMVLLEWKWKRGARPSTRAFIGLALGFAGVALLVDPASLMAGLDGAGFASIVVLLGALSWSIGSLYGRDVRIPSDPFMNTAVQMLGGGAALAVLGVLRGEWGVLDMSAISLTSWLAWGYLLIFGSIVAFSAYVWLLDRASAAQVSTYAYVNPIVAVFLGWLLAGESVGMRVIIAVCVLVAAVVLISRASRSGKRAPRQREIPALRGITRRLRSAFG